MKITAQVEFELPDAVADVDGVAAALDAIRDDVAGHVEVGGWSLGGVNVPAFKIGEGEWAWRADRAPAVKRRQGGPKMDVMRVTFEIETKGGVLRRTFARDAGELLFNDTPVGVFLKSLVATAPTNNFDDVVRELLDMKIGEAKTIGMASWLRVDDTWFEPILTIPPCIKSRRYDAAAAASIYVSEGWLPVRKTP